MPKITKNLSIEETSTNTNTFTDVIIKYILSQLEKEKCIGK